MCEKYLYQKLSDFYSSYDIISAEYYNHLQEEAWEEAMQPKYTKDEEEESPVKRRRA
jgi:hypothetical protein